MGVLLARPYCFGVYGIGLLVFGNSQIPQTLVRDVYILYIGVSNNSGEPKMDSKQWDPA